MGLEKILEQLTRLYAEKDTLVDELERTYPKERENDMVADVKALTIKLADYRVILESLRKIGSPTANDMADNVSAKIEGMFEDNKMIFEASGVYSDIRKLDRLINAVGHDYEGNHDELDEIVREIIKTVINMDLDRIEFVQKIDEINTVIRKLERMRFELEHEDELKVICDDLKIINVDDGDIIETIRETLMKKYRWMCVSGDVELIDAGFAALDRINNYNDLELIQNAKFL